MKRIYKISAFLSLLAGSFFILSLQIILSSFLRAFLKLPYLSITFAFLGLSSAGVFVFFNSRTKTDENIVRGIPRLLDVFGLLLIVYFLKFFPKFMNIYYGTVASKISFFSDNLSLKGLAQSFFNMVFSLSLLNGLYYSVIFFVLGLIFSSTYKILSLQSGKLYFFDLLGATLGCVGGVLLINVMQFSSIPIFLALLAFLFSFCLKLQMKARKISYLISVLFILMAGQIFHKNNVTHFLNPKPSHELWARWNAYSRVSLLDVSKKDDTGRKLRFVLDNGIGVVKFVPFSVRDPYGIKFADGFRASNLGFLYKQPDDLLILFAGVGVDMIEAHSYSKGKTNIVGVELNPLLLSKALEFKDYHLNEFLAKENIQMKIMEGRSYLEKTNKRFDAILYSWAGSPINTYFGISANTSQFLYTEQSFQRLLELLRDDGTIGLVNGNKIRLLGTFKKAFEKIGISDITKHVVIFASTDEMSKGDFSKKMFAPFDSARLVIKKSPFTREDVVEIKKKLSLLSQSVIYAPYMDDVKIDKRLTDLISKILSSHDVDGLMRQLSRKMFINFLPLTDDQPFVDNYFYFSSIFHPHFWDFYFKNYQELIFSHYSFHLYKLVFIFTLILIAIILLAILFITQKKTIVFKRDVPYFWFFCSLGMGFMFAEISFMQRFILYLGNPIYSFSAILSGILFSCGLGSLFSDKIFRFSHLNIRKMSLVCSFMLIEAHFFLSPMLESSLGFPLFYRFISAFFIIFPIGFCLGMLFPQGLRLLGTKNKDLIPLVWGLNGYMSVVGSALSVYFSAIFGFNWLLLASCIMYFSNSFLSIADDK